MDLVGGSFLRGAGEKKI